MSNNLPALIDEQPVKDRFTKLLGKNAAAFTSALINIWANNKQLQSCDARSILGAAGLAATLNLSITPSLGQAYVVPYKDKGVDKAQFQIGVRGLIQLAHRTGKYRKIYAGSVFDGEIRGRDPVTGDLIKGERVSDSIVGYIAYMELTNGFAHSLYMDIAEIDAHAEKYSRGYAYDKRSGRQSSPWSTNFDAMATKTVLKKLLTSWGILSADLAEAIQGDQAVIDKHSFTYVDNGGDVQSRSDIYVADAEPVNTETVNEETGEIEEVTNNED